MRQESILNSIDKVSKIALWIIVGIGIVIIIAIRFEDLADNLIAEFIGVILTGYLIDRLIRKREERQWLPAKCVLYTRLLEMTDELLVAILPLESYEVSGKIYKYKHGDIYAIPTIEPLNQERLSSLPSLIEQDIQIRGPSIITSLSLAKERLDAILDRSAFLLDPESIYLLARLSFVFLSSIPTEVNWAEKGSRKEFARWLNKVILATVEVRTWLECMLDQYFVVEDVTPG